MDIIEQVKTLLQNSEVEQLCGIIPKGVLKLTDEQITTVSFVFWLVYMAENDLNTCLTKAWEMSKKPFTSDIHIIAKAKINEAVGSEACPSCGTLGKGRKIDPENPLFFSDKIKLHQVMMGKTKFVSLLWELNNIRNDLSHGRVNTLSYKNQPLVNRETKVKILTDYLDSMFEVDLSKAKFWSSLSEEQQQEIERMYNEILLNGSIGD
ncbi:MAG: hypothetical protein ACYC44_02205 [Patescibacteria group bacterium]